MVVNLGNVVSGSELVGIVERYSCMEMPIRAVPSVLDVKEVCHLTKPSGSRMCSFVEVWAGVRIFQLCLGFSCSCLRFCWCKIKGTSGSDPSIAEKTIFARCRFNVVICTARTAL